jgi:hypothetical protein
MPDHPVLYWRDNSTRTALSSFDTLDKLISARPNQVIEFNIDDVQLEQILEGGDDSVTNEPGLNPDGTISIYKQQGRSPVPTLTLKGNIANSQTALRTKMRSFSYKVQVDFEYHQFGIIGFFHPDLTDFNKDPTNLTGYTMALPRFIHASNREVIDFTIDMSLGAQSLS